MSEDVQIQSRDYWFKVIEMLQQNWALIDPSENGVAVFFMNDASGVFDTLPFASAGAAEAALRLNGFRRFSEDPEAASFLRCPEPPFNTRPHPNGPIYSAGRFWKTSSSK